MIKYIEDNPIIGKQWISVNYGYAMLNNKKYTINGYLQQSDKMKIKALRNTKYKVNDVLIIKSRTDSGKCMIFVKQGKKK